MPLKFLSFGSLCFFLISITLSLLSPMPCLAQNTNDNNSEISVDVEIYYLPEKMACRDNGYAVPPQKSNCKPWTIKAVENLPQKYKVDDKKHVPPMSIQLSNKLYELLKQYNHINKNHAARRYSILIIFTFNYINSNNKLVTLERRVDDQNTKIHAYEPDQIVEYELVDNRFIHHERADAFSPGEKIQWRLTFGDKVWNLYTLPPP